MNAKLRCAALMAGMMAVLMVGCQSSNQNPPADNATAENTAQPEKKGGGKKARSREAKKGEQSATVAREEKPATVTVPGGTQLSARLVNPIDTGTAKTIQVYETPAHQGGTN